MNRTKFLNNASLIPPYLPDEAVELEPCEPGGVPMTPSWVKSLILLEVHLETATKDGTFHSAIRVLEHCAEMGINGIWLTPIYAKAGGNGYENCGPHTVEPALTRTNDIENGWSVVYWFVTEAHKRNIRVLLDIITWGTISWAPLYSEHPEWYNGEAWGHKAFNWTNTAFVDWFVDTAINNILVTGADGYRCDCEPNYAGYNVWERIRSGCLAKGRKILIIAEDGCERRNAFDMEQDGVLFYAERTRGEQYERPINFYLSGHSLLESIKTGAGHGKAELQSEGRGGRYRFYTYCISNHDYHYSITNGNRLAVGYQAILAPYIPLWYLGAELGMTVEHTVIYFTPIEWERLKKPSVRLFFEDIKRYIRIRRSFPAIFDYFPDDHRNSNICALETSPSITLPAYARYANGEAVAVVPNPVEDTPLFVTVSISSLGEKVRENATVIDLLSGETLAVRDGTFTVSVAGGHIGIYYIA